MFPVIIAIIANGDSDEATLFTTASQFNGWPTSCSFDGWDDDRLRNYSGESGQDNFTVFYYCPNRHLSHQIDGQSNSGVRWVRPVSSTMLEPRHRGSEAGMGVSMGV
jgi:hypothetical protein